MTRNGPSAHKKSAASKDRRRVLKPQQNLFLHEDRCAGAIPVGVMVIGHHVVGQSVMGYISRRKGGAGNLLFSRATAVIVHWPLATVWQDTLVPPSVLQLLTTVAPSTGMWSALCTVTVAFGFQYLFKFVMLPSRSPTCIPAATTGLETSTFEESTAVWPIVSVDPDVTVWGLFATEAVSQVTDQLSAPSISVPIGELLTLNSTCVTPLSSSASTVTMIVPDTVLRIGKNHRGRRIGRWVFNGGDCGCRIDEPKAV